ncbi:HYC_CC_PP family protein [Nibrella viscosa]
MKKTLFQIVNLLMACVVLFSSTGFGLVEHSCQLRGKKQFVALHSAEKQGCKACVKAHQTADTGKTVVKKASCCKEEQRFANVDFSASLSQLVAKLLKAITEAAFTGISVVVSWLVNLLFPDELSDSISLFSPPPALSGRELLAFVQSFLI